MILHTNVYVYIYIYIYDTNIAFRLIDLYRTDTLLATVAGLMFSFLSVYLFS
jgi:hypothetical protein